MQTSEKAIGICPRCKERVEFIKKSSMCRAGDNGYFQSEGWQCSKCLFTPWVLPNLEVEIKMTGEDDESKSNS